MADGWVVQESNAAIVVATWRQVVITRFSGSASMADIDAIRRVSASLARNHPEGIGHLNEVVMDGEGRANIDDDVRGALMRLLSDPAVRLRASSIVYPGAGFSAAFVRSLLGGLVLLSRSRATIRFHASLKEGATWLAETMAATGADPLPASELIRAASPLARPRSASA
jgi:hypothetical protein